MRDGEIKQDPLLDAGRVLCVCSHLLLAARAHQQKVMVPSPTCQGHTGSTAPGWKQDLLLLNFRSTRHTPNTLK